MEPDMTPDEIAEALSVLTPEEGNRLDAAVADGAKCHYCTKKTVYTLNQACLTLKHSVILWNLFELYPVTVVHNKKMDQTYQDRMNVLQFDDCFSYPRERGICAACQDGYRTAVALWSETKLLLTDFDRALDAMVGYQ